MSLLDWVRESPRLRLGLQAGAAVVALALIGLGGWAWYRSQEARGEAALAEASNLAQRAEEAQATAEARDRAAKALESVISEHPRLSALPQAAYQLGNLRFAQGQYDQARKGYELALAKGASGSLRTLAALGIAYTWEQEKNAGNAASAFEAALRDLGSKDFLYEEALLGLARVQEQSGNRPAALETYQRILKELPQSPRTEGLRSRIASLQSRSRP